jgi:hypothetical protein
MKSTTSIRIRVLRFLSERHYRQERPSYFAELFLFVLIIITATWPIISLANALAVMK